MASSSTLGADVETDGIDEDRVIRMLAGGKALQRRRLRRLVLAHLLRERSEEGEDESAAESLGIPTTRLKIATFVASAIAPAAMGSIYAVYLGFIDPPTAFAPNMELTTIAMVLLGGLGTVLGPLVGALVLSGVNEVLWANYPQIYLACVGVIVLLAVLFMPRGIVNLGMKSGWLKIGRPLFRSLAARAVKVPS